MSNSRDLIGRLATPDETGLDATLLIPLLRLLAGGDPVSVEQLASSSGRTVEEVHAGLAAVPDTEYDHAGGIIGQGLTLRPTVHRFTVKDQELYTWCALDTLVFPAIIEQTAQIESVSHATGEPIRLVVAPERVVSVEPSTAVVSLVSPEDLTSIRSSFCHQVHFFTSPDEARSWLDAHAGSVVLPVAEAHELGLELVAAFLAGTAADSTGSAS